MGNLCARLTPCGGNYPSTYECLKELYSIRTGNPQDGVFELAVPFAKVETVDVGSPGEIAGLQEGDRIINFGYIDECTQGEGLSGIGVILRRKLGRSIAVKLYRPDFGVMTVFVTPQTWSGKGTLGCSLQALKCSQKMTTSSDETSAVHTLTSEQSVPKPHGGKRFSLPDMSAKRSCLRMEFSSPDLLRSDSSVEPSPANKNHRVRRGIKFSSEEPGMIRIESLDNLSKHERDSCYYKSDDMARFKRNEVFRRSVFGVRSMRALSREAEEVGELEDNMHYLEERSRMQTKNSFFTT